MIATLTNVTKRHSPWTGVSSAAVWSPRDCPIYGCVDGNEFRRCGPAVANHRSPKVCEPGAQPRLKSWGGPRFGSQHPGACAPRPVKGQAGCWVRGVPLRGSGVSPPGKFLKTQMLNPVFWWLLAVKCLAFWKLRPRSWGTNTLLVPPNLKVGGPVSPGPYGCCAYGVNVEQRTSLCRSSGVGACWRRIWAHNRLSDGSVHCRIGTGRPVQRSRIRLNQCNYCRRMGAMWSRRRATVTSRAAAFWTDYRRRISLLDTPCSSALQ